MSIAAWAERARAEPYRSEPEDQHTTNTFEALLTDQTSPHDAAKSITQAYGSLLSKRPHDQTAHNQASVFWAILCDAARNFGMEHAERLADLLIATKAMPDVLDKGRQIKNYNGRVYWKDLPDFGVVFRESGVYVDGEAIEDDTTGEAWKHQAFELTNATAFAATLLMRSSLCVGMSWHAMVALVDALEWSITDMEHGIAMWLPPAAMWITIAGEKIRQYCIGDLISGASEVSAGRLWEGGNGFSVERWLFWKQRFEEYARDSDGALDDGLREYAAGAVARMASLEADRHDHRLALQ